jgi:hypothetical protein
MALTWEDLNGKVQDKIIPTVADVVYKSSPVFVRIRTNNGQQFDGGIKIRQNIGYAELNGGPFGRGETFNTDYVQTDTAFAVDPKFYYVNVSLYGTDDVLARGPMQAVPFVGSKLANAAGKMAKLIATDMYLDGLGTSSSTKSVDGFNQWFDNGSLFTTVGGITRTDLGVSNGTNNQGANGYVASLSSGFSLKAVELAMGSCWFGVQHVDMLVSDQNSWNWFFNKLQPMQRFNEESSDVAKAGFRSFNFIGAQVVVDQYSPAGSMYGMNTKQENLMFFTSTLKRYQFGFTGFKEIYNSDDRSGQYLWAGNIIVANPRYNFRLTNIPTLS